MSMATSHLIAAALLLAGTACPATAQDLPPVSIETARSQALVMPMLTTAEDGRVLARVPAADKQGIASTFLHVTTLRTGIGSSDVGLDRASVTASQLAQIRRIGAKAVVQYIDPRLRAAGRPAYDRNAVSDSFARRTVLIADVIDEQPDGTFAFDLTPMLQADTSDLASALTGETESVFSLVSEKSLVDSSSLRTFPRNAEVDALLTFEAAKRRNAIPGPAGRQVTLEVHHSLVALPTSGYTPRPFDPRIGGITTQTIDFNAPLGKPVVIDLTNRFRLEKVAPLAARSRVVEPIVFYVDREAPEPVRSALIEGASWWKEAFDAAGYIDAFDVRIMPDGVDPMDIRYNVINWVNRETRGWSYGQAIADPRTGEIIKGSVLLGSLRVRQDLLILDALQVGDEAARSAALARIRQLAAHEVGHALGLIHNFAGSSQQRSSVMDYPAPRIELIDGAISVQDAYGVGLGAWDRFAIEWLYGKEYDDPSAANARLVASQDDGIAFIADEDARPLGGANAAGSLWDDGGDPVDELRRILVVREAAIKKFDQTSIRTGRPLSELQRAFVPVWLLHRYQVEATAKLVAGLRYEYGVSGSARGIGAQAVGAAEQDQALDALLLALDAERLTVPEDTRNLLSGAAAGSSDPQFDREVLITAGPSVFDPLVAADVGAQVVLDALFDPSRLSRAIVQNAADPDQPSAVEIIERTLAAVSESLESPAGRRIAYRAVLSLATLEDAADPEVSLVAAGSLDAFADRLRKTAGRGATRMWREEMADLIEDRETLRARLVKKKAPTVPPGMPIG